MAYRFIGCAAILVLSACSGSRETPRDTHPIATSTAAPTTATSTPVVVIPTEAPAPSAAPSPSAAEPIASAIASAPTPTASANASPPPDYPIEWIRKAHGENVGLSCFELVYKRGCAETRTGTVTFDVTINDDGSVMKFVEVDNLIHNDKAVVSRCLKKNLPRWRFHPPEGNSKTFRLDVHLSDRC